MYDFDKYLSRSNIFMNIFRKTSANQFVTSIRWSKYVCTYINILQKYLCESCISVCCYRDIPPIFSIVLYHFMLYYIMLYYSLRYTHICIAFPVSITSNRNRLLLTHNFITNLILSFIYFIYFLTFFFILWIRIGIRGCRIKMQLIYLAFRYLSALVRSRSWNIRKILIWRNLDLVHFLISIPGFNVSFIREFHKD